MDHLEADVRGTVRFFLELLKKNNMRPIPNVIHSGSGKGLYGMGYAKWLAGKKDSPFNMPPPIDCYELLDLRLLEVWTNAAKVRIIVRRGPDQDDVFVREWMLVREENGELKIWLDTFG